MVAALVFLLVTIIAQNRPDFPPFNGQGYKCRPC